MPFDRRLQIALLACALGLTSACQRAHPSETSVRPVVAAGVLTAPSPDQIVRTRAPRDEIAVLNGKVKFSAVLSAPNDIVRGQVQAKRADEWKTVVLGIGRMNNWVGYTRQIDVNGKIEIGLADGLVLFSAPLKNHKLLNVVNHLDQDRQPILISGAVSGSFLDATRLSNDPNFPTCFESRIGSGGCQVDLTNISPLPAQASASNQVSGHSAPLLHVHLDAMGRGAE